MTKKQFATEAKQLGFAHYKNLVEKLGYHTRTLDRFKENDVISKKFIKSFEEYKAGAKPIEKEDLGKIEVAPIKNTKKEKKIEQKEETTQKTQNTTPKQNDGIGVDISNEEYHGSGKMSVSKLKVIIDNAKEFESRYVTKNFEQKETDALIVGRLHHTLVMEAHKLHDDYVFIDLPTRPIKEDYVKAVEALGGEIALKENTKNEIVVADTIDTLKEKLDELKKNTKKVVCTKAHLELAEATSAKALNSVFKLEVNGKTLLEALLSDLLALPKCYVEKSFYGEIDGIAVQIRPDILINLGASSDVWFVIDLKTLEVATPSEFVRQGGKFFWDMQEQFYLEVLRQNGINAKAFYFNCAGKKEYSGAQFYEWGVSTKDEAKKVVKAGFKKYKYCVENNVFQEGKFDYKNLKFEAITTLDVPIYRQYAMGDLGA